MAGLPNIPNLDPDADPGEELGEDGIPVNFDDPGGLADELEPDDDEAPDYGDTVAMNPSELAEKLAETRHAAPAVAAPAPAPAPAPAAKPAAAAPTPNAFDVAASTAASAAAPAPAASAPAEPSSHTEESLEEVLAQTSEHTVRLMRLEETLLTMKETLDDAREEMHAGFIQSSQKDGGKPAAQLDTSAVSGHIAELEMHVGRVERAQGRLILFAIVNLVALLIVAVVLLIAGGSKEAVPPPFPTTAPDKVELPPQPVPDFIDKPSETPPRKKRRRRR